jgi:hypothetical protein
LGGIDQTEKFVEFETLGRGGEEFFEDPGGGGEVASVVFGYGGLELAVEVGGWSGLRPDGRRRNQEKKSQ